MDLKIVRKRIESIDADLIVLKGFPVDTVNALSTSLPLIDEYVYEDGKIHLDRVHAGKMLQAVITLSNCAICCCESLILLCNNVANLEILGKRIVVLENNLRQLYPNPSSEDVPDFETSDLDTSESTTPLYSAYYSFASKEGSEVLIQYIDNYSELNSGVKTIPLVEPVTPQFDKLEGTAPQRLSNNEIEGLLLRISEHGIKGVPMDYLVDEAQIDMNRLAVLNGLGKLLHHDFRFFVSRENIEIHPRAEFKEILNRIWNYADFRSLRFYKNPTENRELMEIPQNEIMEIVVSECEKAYQGNASEMNNILLTAPTGSGKSLLFQLPAIYLAEKYGLMTIVVSPLVALMDDQVEGLTAYPGVATLNSNRTASEKEQILADIKDGMVNILYLSPELLLSYSIETFIGDRRIGLFVVDEAHTVTTWGRDFRVDYLFLGDYIRKTKKTLGYTFPIFALTATAVLDPSGRNDMVFNTIRSLNMDPCLKFIGHIRRNNIVFDFGLSEITRNYEQQRRALTIQRIREAIASNIKSLVYFPFKKTINDIVFSDDTEDIRNSLASYHAGLFPNIKMQNALDFKTGRRPVMCATKAYGMGIDVSDIMQVYHHAPSGTLSDYVQEIGRIARDPNVTGVAKVDFSPNDFRYSRKLHGLSTIRTWQLREVLRKLMELYRLNGEKRNMLISASDFSYIFPLSSEDSLDQNLKSALLLISNDLLNKLRFHSLIVRPKSMFGKCYVGVESRDAKQFHRKYLQYLKKETNNVFLLDADRLWMDRFSNLSFPRFKFKLNEGKVFTDFNVTIRQKITLSLHEDRSTTLKEIEEFFALSNAFIQDMAANHHRLKISDMKARLPRGWNVESKDRFVETFKMLFASAQGSKVAYCSIYSSHTSNNPEISFQFIQSGYENITTKYLSSFRQHVKTENSTTYVDRNDSYCSLCEFLNSYGVATYRREGGEEPMIFVRINNPAYLNYMVRRKDYDNDILSNIYDMHAYSERVFSYFFTTRMTDEERWDFIEDYFLGVPENQLLK